MRLGLTLLVIGVTGVSLSAQEPQPAPIPKSAVYGDDPLLPPPPTVEALCGNWKADVVVGLPTALRLSHRVGESKAWLEAGAGIYAIVPTFFTGVRIESDLYVGRRHSWHVSPGLDVYFSPATHFDGGALFGDKIGALGAATVDFDLIWRVKWHERCQSHLGLKIGAGVAAGSGGWGPVPILGLVGGWQF